MSILDKKTTEPDEKIRTWEEVKLLFPLVIEDIRYHKNQQIFYLHYTIVLYSAILVLLQNYLSNITCIHRVIISVLSLVIAIFGMWFVWNANDRIKVGRERADKLSEYYSDDIQKLMDFKAQNKKAKGLSQTIFWFFVFIQFIGEVVLLCLILSGR